MSVLKATELHALKWFLLNTVNFTSIFTKDTACSKLVSAAEGMLGAGWHFRKGVREGLPGEGREEPCGDEGGSLGRERTAKTQRRQGAGLGRLEQSARGGTQVQDRQGTDRGTLWASEGLGLWAGRWGGSERTPWTVDQGCRRLGMVVAQTTEAGSNSGAV